jgi:hypothetical protein
MALFDSGNYEEIRVFFERLEAVSERDEPAEPLGPRDPQSIFEHKRCGIFTCKMKLFSRKSSLFLFMKISGYQEQRHNVAGYNCILLTVLLTVPIRNTSTGRLFRSFSSSFFAKLTCREYLQDRCALRKAVWRCSQGAGGHRSQGGLYLAGYLRYHNVCGNQWSGSVTGTFRASWIR